LPLGRCHGARLPFLFFFLDRPKRTPLPAYANKYFPVSPFCRLISTPFQNKDLPGNFSLFPLMSSIPFLSEWYLSPCTAFPRLFFCSAKNLWQLSSRTFSSPQTQSFIPFKGAPPSSRFAGRHSAHPSPFPSRNASLQAKCKMYLTDYFLLYALSGLSVTRLRRFFAGRSSPAFSCSHLIRPKGVSPLLLFSLPLTRYLSYYSLDCRLPFLLLQETPTSEVLRFPLVRPNMDIPSFLSLQCLL